MFGRAGASLLIASAIALTVVPSPSFAQGTAATADTASIAARVDSLLGESNATSKQWRAVGSEAVGPLVQILADGRQSEARRGRAAIGLSFLKSAKSKAALRSALGNQSTPNHVRQKVIVAVARMEGAGAVGLIAHELTHVSQGVRGEAIKAIGRIGTPKAYDVLRAHQKTETAGSLKTVLNQQLAKAGE